MEQANTRPVWMDDELVKNIPQKKLEFAETLFSKGHGKSQKEMMTLILPMMKQAKAEHLTFSAEELNACIQAIKKHSSEEELNQINSILTKNKMNNI